MRYVKLKIKAFFIHLVLSILAVGLLLIVATQWWYPGSLFALEDTWEALKILIPVDVVLGPLLTLALYAPNKKNLKLDLSVIAAVQLSALIYGAWVIYTQRPTLIVFDIKEFQVIPAPEQVHQSLLDEYFSEGYSGLQVVYAIPPQTPEEVNHFLTKAIAYQKQPERLRPINDYVEVIKGAAISLESLTETKNPEALAKIKKKLDSEGLYLFPLRGSLGSFGRASYVIVDLNKHRLVDFVDIEDLPPSEENSS